MRAAHWQIRTFRIVLILGLLFAIYLAARRAMGSWFFRKGSPEAVQTATRWDPGNPEYYNVLGTQTHLYAVGENSNLIVQLYRSAACLSPHDAQFRADLGAAYDWAGRSEDALEAFQRARKLFPNSPDINWRLANFYVRAGKVPAALDALRMVLLGDATSSRRVFVLATSATRDDAAILEMLPPRPEIYFDYLQFQLEKENLAEANEIWARILQRRLPFEPSASFPYLDALIHNGEHQRLVEAWSALVERFPKQIPRSDPSSNLITNGGFEFEILNGGLDWRVVPTPGAVAGIDQADPREGVRTLRISFDGSRNVDYGHVFQFVPVQPNTRYLFSANMRLQGITTDSGPRFQILDGDNVNHVLLSTENLTGTSGWSEQRAEFMSMPNTHLLLVRVTRPASSKFDNQIAGSVWIDNVILRAAGHQD